MARPRLLQSAHVIEEHRMPASRSRRPYESPLRTEQMDRTREKLIQAGVDIVTEAGGEELTLRRVAARAAVSVPTAYRYFQDRDALLEDMAQWIHARVGGPTIPPNTDGIAAWVQRIYEGLETNDRLMRASLSTPAGRVLRAKGQAARRPKLLAMVKRSFPSSTVATQRRLTALFQLLVNTPAWVALHDHWGMSGVEAGKMTGWAMETLLAEVRRHPTALDFEQAAEAPAAAHSPAASATQARPKVEDARRRRR